MRFPQRPSQSPLCLLNLILLFADLPVSAKPYPRNHLLAELANDTLDKRACTNPCGWSGQLCCASNQQCYTDSAGQAQCGAMTGAALITGNSQAVGGPGQWQYFTTTYVQTDFVTRVSTYSSYVGGVGVAAASAPPSGAPALSTYVPPATTSVGLQCNIPCGSICCASGQFCATAGQCQASGADISSKAYGSYLASSTYVPSASLPYSAPLRPTSGSATTSTSTQSVTTTVPFQTPVGTAGGIVYGTGQTTPNKGLSGGAIAGIVIGVLLAIALLLLLCCFASVRGLIGGRRKTVHKKTTSIRRSYQSGSIPPPRKAWYGALMGGRKRTRPSESEKSKKHGFGFAKISAGLLALAVTLGIKRHQDRHKKVRSDYGSDGTSTDPYYDGSATETTSQSE